ncbi:unnamed protein product [Lampetra planeri]
MHRATSLGCAPPQMLSLPLNCRLRAFTHRYRCSPARRSRTLKPPALGRAESSAAALGRRWAGAGRGPRRSRGDNSGTGFVDVSSCTPPTPPIAPSIGDLRTPVFHERVA